MKIKWNWGTKLVIAMAAFMIMVVLFVVRMVREDVDLVEKDYYPKGQAYQDLIDKRSNAAGFADQILLTVEQGVVRISFPTSFNPAKIEGTVHFYQRVAEQNDRLVKLTVDANHFFSYPAKSLSGRYIVKIDWAYEGEAYYVEKNMNLP